MKHQSLRQGQTTTPGTMCLTLFNKCVGSLVSPANHVKLKMLETGPTVYDQPPELLNIVDNIIAMFLITSPIVINVRTRGLLAVETTHAIVQWLENLNITRNMTSMFVNKKHHYTFELLWHSIIIFFTEQ